MDRSQERVTITGLGLVSDPPLPLDFLALKMTVVMMALMTCPHREHWVGGDNGFGLGEGDVWGWEEVSGSRI